MRIFLVFLTLFSSATATASTIDINLGAAPCDLFCEGTISVDGFDFTTDPFFRNLGFWGFDNEQTITMVHSSGDSFGLVSLSADINLNGSWAVKGFYAGGGTVQTFIESGTFSFDSSWQDLQSVEFMVQPGGLYSLTASIVPIPAAAWLFGSALAGLGWLRRRQSV